MAKDNLNKLFRLIEIIAENQTIREKKTADEEKWTNEMFLEGVDEMVNSITYMFREISVTQQIPNQWKTMRIKSIQCILIYNVDAYIL